MNLKSTVSQQSLVNEVKGHLFEYVFSHFLAQKGDGEYDFTSSLSESEMNRLKEYQYTVLKNDPVLYRQLPILAKAMSDYYVDFHRGKEIKNIALVSRLKNADHNADVIVEFSDGKKDFVSLKLCKLNVFVNTKSAGIKSFFSKYFFQANSSQDKLNLRVTQAFEKMRYLLLDTYGYDLGSMDFQAWTSDGQATLPGQLPDRVREYLLEYYHHCLMGIYDEVNFLLEKQPVTVCKTFLDLCGLNGHGRHLFCFHQGTSTYKLAKITDLDARELKEEIPILQAPSRGSSYFLVKYKSIVLQIRVKPMRDFTVPAMKINCSIKLKD